MANSSVNARPYEKPVRELPVLEFKEEFKAKVTEMNSNGRHGVYTLDANGKRVFIGYVAENYTKSKTGWAKLGSDGLWCICNNREEVEDFFDDAL